VSINLEFDIEIVNNATEWELLLDNLLTSDTYIKWSWGDYKRRCGWDIKRLQIVDTHSRKIIACCQLQSKQKGFISINLLQGGIHLSKENHIKDAYDCVHRTVRSYIKNNNWLWLLLINYQSHNLDEADISLMKLGFAPIFTNKMFTKLIFNENNDLDISSLSKNWRHNLKRAKNNELMEEIGKLIQYDKLKKVKLGQIKDSWSKDLRPTYIKWVMKFFSVILLISFFEKKRLKKIKKSLIQYGYNPEKYGHILNILIKTESLKI